MPATPMTTLLIDDAERSFLRKEMEETLHALRSDLHAEQHDRCPSKQVIKEIKGEIAACSSLLAKLSA